jgi:uncharacterized protein
MPKRSLHSRVLVWPKRDEVMIALRAWAESERTRNPKIVRIGCFGSIAHGGYGVGSDADVVVVIRDAPADLAERALQFDTHGLPVNVDLLVYSEPEWQQVLERKDRFATEMHRAIWL